RAPRPAFRGFTLIDLLVAVTIIAILATIGLGALNSARESARVAKTQATVTKLHYLIMNKYDSYRTRRLPINTVGMNPNVAARARLNAVRDLMRMEMPDRFTDITDGPLTGITQPSLSLRYRRIVAAATGATDEHGAAECLYLIVSAIPGAMEQFHSNEIADVDNDGLPEFIDAWGNPIRFIRWPAGFYAHAEHDFHGDSELQFGPDPLPCGDPNPKYQPDPFDPTKQAPGDFALFPLVYSAGPDEEYDINRGLDSSLNTYAYVLTGGNLEIINPMGVNYEIGRPMNNRDPSIPFGDLRHYDNIHNHRSP
ncbi:MAG: type II secretion system protein, partial [Pirellulaceae bacterium]|nr:type II secretion system protein [Pirellulaceae bacterium]